MKQTTLALAIITALALTACGESAEEKQARLFKEQQAQIQQLQAQQVQQAQQQQFQQPQQYAPQPQVIQQPAAPVVVQAPHQDNTLTNLATGALIGHALSGGFNGGSNSAPAERIVEHKTVIVNNHPAPAAPTTSFAPPASVAPAPVAPAPVAPAPVAPRASGMDMNKLSQSSSYAPRPSTPAPRASSSMNMSRLSSKR
jgi:hypothetical protein